MASTLKDCLIDRCNPKLKGLKNIDRDVFVLAISFLELNNPSKDYKPIVKKLVMHVFRMITNLVKWINSFDANALKSCILLNCKDTKDLRKFLIITHILMKIFLSDKFKENAKRFLIILKESKPFMDMDRIIREHSKKAQQQQQQARTDPKEFQQCILSCYYGDNKTHIKTMQTNSEMMQRLFKSIKEGMKEKQIVLVTEKLNKIMLQNMKIALEIVDKNQIKTQISEKIACIETNCALNHKDMRMYFIFNDLMMSLYEKTEKLGIIKDHSDVILQIIKQI